MMPLLLPFLQAYDNAKSINGKSQAAVLAAIVFLACRHTGNPRTFKEICAVVPQASVKVGGWRGCLVGRLAWFRQLAWSACQSPALPTVLAALAPALALTLTLALLTPAALPCCAPSPCACRRLGASTRAWCAS